MILQQKLAARINQKFANHSIIDVLTQRSKAANNIELTKRAFIAPLVVEAGKFMLPMVAASIARKQLVKNAPKLARRDGLLGRIGKGLPNFLNRPVASAAAVDMPVMGLTSIIGNPMLDTMGKAVGYNPNVAHNQNMNNFNYMPNEGFNKLSEIVKQAFQNPGNMTSEDFASIKKELAGRGVSSVYNDFEGEQRRAYNEYLLKARDAAVDDIPAISGGIAGLKGGLLGAGIGGALGYGGGHLLGKTPLLNLPFKTRSMLPAALGGSAALLSGILSAMPAAKSKYDAVQALKKLQNTDNVNEATSMNSADQYLLHS
jgi:hypothetical protein